MAVYTHVQFCASFFLTKNCEYYHACAAAQLFLANHVSSTPLAILLFGNGGGVDRCNLAVNNRKAAP